MRCLLAFVAPVLAFSQIQYSEAKKVWLFTTRSSSYAMGVAADGALRNLYWGAPLWRVDDLTPPRRVRDRSSFDPHQMLENEEFPGWGGPRYLRARAQDLPPRRRSRPRPQIRRRTASDGDELDIDLKDIRDAIQVTLHYRVYPDHGILRRSATIRNATPRR